MLLSSRAMALGRADLSDMVAPSNDPTLNVRWGLEPSRLAPPRSRATDVVRSSLLARMSDSGAPVISLIAPHGYGKTTALALYVREATGPIAWLTVGEDCHDPIVLARYLSSAFASSPVSVDLERELDAVDHRPSIVRAGLAAVVSEAPASLLIVIDDIQELTPPGAELIHSIIDNAPPSAQVALAGTHAPSFLGQVRATGDLLDLGEHDLEFDLDESEELFRGAGMTDIPPEDLADIWERTEGWAAGLYLAALALRKADRDNVPLDGPFHGDHRFVTEFLGETVLRRLPADQVDFLLRTAVLEELSGPLCDAVLETSGSAALLEDLDEENVFVVRLDERHERYRYHRLFRDCLITELQHRNPDLQPLLHARASTWYEEQSAPDRAIDHAIAGHDTDRVAELLVMYAQGLYYGGRAAAISNWLEWFSLSGPGDAYPEVAVLATWFMIMTGRPIEAEGWALAASTGAARQPIQPPFEGVRLLARAVMCREGVDQMARDVDLAMSMLPSANPWLPNAYVLLALTSLMRGQVDDAVKQLEAGLDHSTELGTVTASAFILSELAICALHRFEVDTAARHVAAARDAIERGRLEGYSVSALAWAVAARVALLQGDLERVERWAADADAIRSKLTWAIPALAVQCRLDLARCAIGLGDVRRARSYLTEVDDIVSVCPDLGTLIEETREIEAELADRMETGLGIAALTPAESRLLPLLTTHLTLGEIAEQLFVSPHTVKTHAIRIYRKLGVTSRGEAVEVARRLGLLGS